MICPHCKFNDKAKQDVKPWETYLSFLNVELPFYHNEPDSNYIDVYICPKCCILFATKGDIENFLTPSERPL